MGKYNMLDKEGQLPEYSAYCSFCKHIIRYRECKAFKVIPESIWMGKEKHEVPVKNQTGTFIFERVN